MTQRAIQGSLRLPAMMLKSADCTRRHRQAKRNHAIMEADMNADTTLYDGTKVWDNIKCLHVQRLCASDAICTSLAENVTFCKQNIATALELDKHSDILGQFRANR